jgi:TetR/AcrR family transcriptional regulator, transcriptional repressor for nem operon
VKDGTTAERILDVAQRLVQSRGFNGFSYADIAERLGIRKASLHYHFQTKDDLGRALMARYRERFRGALEAIEAASADARERLRRYAKLYLSVLRDEDRMCLCGMLAADFTTLARAVRDEVRRFFDDNEAWLARVLEAGRKSRRLAFKGPAASQAVVLVSGLEGAMLVSRSTSGSRRFEETARRLLASVGA